MIRTVQIGVVALVLGWASIPSNSQTQPASPPRIPRILTIDPPIEDGAAPRPTIGEVHPSKAPSGARLLGVEKIWAEAPHNAFTDLIRFRERWYCTFREGSKHVSPDGALRVISSSDGVEWVSVFHIATEYADLRDPKLSITGDNRLMLSAVAAYNPPTEIGHHSLAWYSLDGRDWGDPFKIGDPEVWLWRVVWHRRSAYSMAYSTLQDRFLRMYVGPEGLRFQIVADRILQDGKPSETTLLFNRDDSALCLLRRDGGDATALLGRSRPPYRGWQWKDLGLRLGGPAMIRLPDGRLVAAGRIHDPKARTALLWVDDVEGRAEVFLTLPSGGDCSYPGLVFYENTLWASYYSSHEGAAAVYLARISLPELESEQTDGRRRY